jgi:hypothetical protein
MNFQPSQDPQPSLEKLTGALFGSCATACIFQYVDLPAPHPPPPEADLNVERELEVIADVVPAPIPLQIQQGCTSWEFPTSQTLSLERCTRGQSSNSIWREQRVGRITASNIHAVWTKVQHIKNSFPKRIDCSSLLEKLCIVGPDLSHVAALKYGQSMEGEARKKYFEQQKKEHRHLQVSECGMFVVNGQCYIGASPDALVDCSCCGEGLLEIKCPLTLAHADPQQTPPSYIEMVGDHLTLKKGHPYYSQVIAQMGATGRKWCDFFVYSRHGSLTVRVLFDDHWWHSLKESCCTFFTDYMIDFMTQQF